MEVYGGWNQLSKNVYHHNRIMPSVYNVGEKEDIKVGRDVCKDLAQIFE